MTENLGLNMQSGNAQAHIEALKLCIAPTGTLERKLKNINLFATRIFQVSVSLISYSSEEKEHQFAQMPQEEEEQLIKTGNEPALLVSPWIAAESGYQFYASAPVKKGELNIGTLCLLDKQPRKFSEPQQSLLNNLAAIASQVITSRTIMFLIAASMFLAQDVVFECVDVVLI